jgi:hypothetical protein
MTEQEFWDSLSPEDRLAFKEHSFSISTLEGAIIFCNPPAENLFEIVLSRKRYIVDRNTNESWQTTAAKSANQDKAFILGKTMSDEEYNIKSLFFGKKVQKEKGNLFVLGMADWEDCNAICLERIDEYFRSVFDPQSLKSVSSEGGRGADERFLKWERNRREIIEHERQAILLLLGVKAVSELGLPAALACKMSSLASFIRNNARQCLGNWRLSGYVARHCYAMLLAENFPQIRCEFAEADYLNVFGDTLIVHNALFMEAGILSNDGALKRMAGFCGLECVNGIS